MAPVRPSEDELGRKWDRCLVDTTFKTVGGAVFGGVFSLLFFKRSAWPITLGIGIGLGAGYSNCRHQFLWHGPLRPPFGRPPWGGGRPLWARYGKDDKSEHSSSHQDDKFIGVKWFVCSVEQEGTLRIGHYYKAMKHRKSKMKYQNTKRSKKEDLPATNSTQSQVEEEKPSDS